MLDAFPNLPGFNITEKIYDGANSLVYRGERKSDQTPVIIKCLKSDFPDFDELLQFRNQYTLTRNLQSDGIVIPLSLENYNNKLVLIMEDTSSIDLRHHLHSTELLLETFFTISISLSIILSYLHINNIIHKDINPNNILINQTTGHIQLIDFSISSMLPKENQTMPSINALEGTLTYLSPEQTGRMNRGIDYRTDFYSLGVTFYECLTGRPPFQSNDPMELVHAHLAKKPTPPMELNTEIPQTLNNIILKLLEKNAEERYQSASGLKHDLEICQQQWEKQSEIKPFTLGQHDMADRFQISEKLYGRQDDVTKLIAAFDRARKGGAELILVTGISGIGKTALVNEVHKPITRERGYFIKGKFDQFKRNIPFSAIAQAFQMLMQQLTNENPDQIQTWKTEILAALGDNGQIIVDIIPELEDIIGKQSSVPTLEGNAAQNRFNFVFQKFIQVFTTSRHPLVLFLDDLQWFDSASLRLISLLMNPATNHHLLLIGAYRDNEVAVGHPLLLALDSIKKTGLTPHNIALAPLTRSDLNQLITDAFKCPSEYATPLTQAIQQKTHGNPFFIHQFMKLLYEEKLINYNFKKCYWRYDLIKVKQLATSYNVVEFMTVQLKKLPLGTQLALQLSACIGNQFELSTLATVAKKSQREIATNLWKAVQDGLMIPLNEGYKAFQSTDAPSKEQPVFVQYRFSHDRVQQAAYALIPDTQKTATHLKIGRLLKSLCNQSNADKSLFELVNQLNLGASLITARAERNELAQFNLEAGVKAKTSTAYTAACGYFNAGIAVLADDSWQNQYTMTLQLYESAAESAFLKGDFSQQTDYVDIVLTSADTLLDKINAYQTQFLSFIARNQPLKSIQAALPVLKQLGIEFPDQPNTNDFNQWLDETQILLANKDINYFLELPPMKNKESRAIARIIATIFAASYVAMPTLMPLLVFKQIQLSVKYGYTPESIEIYAGYGVILGSLVGNIDIGYEYGQLAVSLLEKHNVRKYSASTFTTVYSTIKPWKTHIRLTLTPFLEGYQNGLETGDMYFSAACATYYCFYSYFSNEELTYLKEKMDIFKQAIAKTNQETILNSHNIAYQSVLNLVEAHDIPYYLQGNVYDERIMLPQHENNNDHYALATLYIHKMLLCYLFQENHEAVKNASIGEQHLDGIIGTYPVAIFYFYDSLARLAVFPELPQEEQTTTLKKIEENQKKMQHWAQHAPMNFQHKWDLVEAERLRVIGQFIDAMDFYDLAISGAKANEYVQEEAMANELAGRFYLSWVKLKFAEIYITESYYSYARWGAKAKIADLENHYPELLAPVLNKEGLLSNRAEIVSVSQTVTNLDLNTVMKASRTLSGELALTSVLEKMLDIAMENAGAQRCVLLLNDEGKWTIEGESRLDTDSRNILPNIALEEYDDLPATLIQYVIDRQQSMVLDDAQKTHRFHQDPYFKAHLKLKSILCMPILSQSKLTGLLYLENNLIADAFRAENLEMLQMLSAQAAISIENAALYEHLEEKVMQRTQELKAAQAELIKQAHESGMAEMAIGVMHNIGNALTPAKVGVITSQKRLQESPLRLHLSRALTALPDVIAQADINDSDKNRLTQIIDLLPKTINDEYQQVINELERVGERHNHIEGIIHLQMRYARVQKTNEPFNFNQMIEDALRMLEDTLTAGRIKAVTQFAELPLFDGEENRLLQVLVNLIKNACEAMQTTAQEARLLTITTELEDGSPKHLILSVLDNGIGFDPKEKDSLFNFGYTTKSSGSGFGLHASANYLIAQKGSIEAYSEGENTGAKFIIRLPTI